MADNVPITPGSGASIATDDVSGIQYQRVKLDIGGDGASVPVVGAGSGLPVDVNRVQGDVSTKPKAGETWPVSVASPVTVQGAVTVQADPTAPAAVRLSDGSVFIAGLPVSGTVGATQGTPAAAASGWPVKITDGTSIVGVSDVSGAKAIKVDVVQSVVDAASQADLTTLGQVTPIAGDYNDAVSDPTAGQAAAVRVTLKRALHVNPRKSDGTEIGTASNPIYIGAATAPGVFPVNGTVTAKLNDGSGSAFSPANPVPVMATASGRTRVTKVASLTASQSAIDLWAPSGGKKFVVTKVIISVTVTGTLSIYDSNITPAANILMQGAQAVGNREYDFGSCPWISATANNVLRWTSGSGLAGDLIVHGYEE